MVTDTSIYKTPSGISPGISKSDILDLLQIDSNYINFKQDEWQISNNEMVTMVLEFGNDLILKKLEIGIDLP